MAYVLKLGFFKLDYFGSANYITPLERNENDCMYVTNRSIFYNKMRELPMYHNRLRSTII